MPKKKRHWHRENIYREDDILKRKCTIDEQHTEKNMTKDWLQRKRCQINCTGTDIMLKHRAKSVPKKQHWYKEKDVQRTTFAQRSICSINDTGTCQIFGTYRLPVSYHIPSIFQFFFVTLKSFRKTTKSKFLK